MFEYTSFLECTRVIYHKSSPVVSICNDDMARPQSSFLVAQSIISTFLKRKRKRLAAAHKLLPELKIGFLLVVLALKQPRQFSALISYLCTPQENARIRFRL